jgi:hypothetical protein
MTDDDKALVDELRINDTEIYLPLLGKAADRIEALSAENERLREVLTRIGFCETSSDAVRSAENVYNSARRALGEQQ